MATTSSAEQKAWLYLADGTLYEGISCGAKGTTGGEICFNTGMTGYQEVFSDPSYTGQILIMNAPYVGNYGVKASEVESDSAKIRGLVCKNFSSRYSRMTAEGSLDAYLDAHGIVGISDLDTRALVRHIRSKGAMNAIISTEFSTPQALKAAVEKLPPMGGLELSSQISTPEAYDFGDPASQWRIAVLDFGVKRNILQCLADRGAYMKVYPARSSWEDIQSFDPHGVFFSNGPGDPASMDYATRIMQEVLEAKLPMFGICLGHQLLARSLGIATFKMHHGHRGLNHPVKNLSSGRSEMTTQNHGFGIDRQQAEQHPEVEITHLNLNDGSVEGIRLRNQPAFSVQYHPESTPGPHDALYLFDAFMDLIAQAHKSALA